MSLTETLKLSFDMTKVLTNMEVNGIKINVDTLHQLRDEYQTEMIILNKNVCKPIAFGKFRGDFGQSFFIFLRQLRISF